MSVDVYICFCVLKVTNEKERIDTFLSCIQKIHFTGKLYLTLITTDVTTAGSTGFTAFTALLHSEHEWLN